MGEQYEELKRLIIQSTVEANKRQEEILDAIQEVKTSLKEEKEKTAQLENKVVKLTEKYVDLEREVKKNNTIIFGLNPKESDLLSFTLEMLKSKLDIDIRPINIDDIYSIRKGRDKRPIIITFVAHLKKIEVFKNAKKLKGTEIYISEERSVEDREISRILLQHLKLTREQNIPAKIKNYKLFVNGTWYTAEQLENYEDTEEEQEEEELTDQRQNNKIDTQNTEENTSVGTPLGNIGTTAVGLSLRSNVESRTNQSKGNLTNKRKAKSPVQAVHALTGIRSKSDSVHYVEQPQQSIKKTKNIVKKGE